MDEYEYVHVDVCGYGAVSMAMAMIGTMSATAGRGYVHDESANASAYGSV